MHANLRELKAKIGQDIETLIVNGHKGTVMSTEWFDADCDHMILFMQLVTDVLSGRPG